MAFSRLAQNNQDIWLQDGERTGRMTFDGAREVYPIWSPDGSRIAYLSAKSGAGDIYQKRTNGAGAEELLSKSNSIKFPSGWSADGRYILYFTVDARNRTDIWVLPTTGDRKPFPFLQSPFTDVWGQFSPDGRWVAYQSDESGRDEVYVRPFIPPEIPSQMELQPAANGRCPRAAECIRSGGPMARKSTSSICPAR